jgi:hypothetical protein
MNIIIEIGSKVGRNFARASLENHSNDTYEGRSEEEAVGKLILAHKMHFGIASVEKKIAREGAPVGPIQLEPGYTGLPGL